MVHQEEAHAVVRIHREIAQRIEERLAEFRRLAREGSEEELLAELVFCLLTPQSRARVCWAAVERMRSRRVLTSGDAYAVLGELHGVRFKYRKAEYVAEAVRRYSTGLRELLEGFGTPEEAREHLVREVRGMGYKEASHFLRNTGFGLELAVLDRHILKNLKALGVLDAVPGSLSGRTYTAAENAMRRFSEDAGIPMAHLDFVLWYRETGDVFK